MKRKASLATALSLFTALTLGAEVLAPPPLPEIRIEDVELTGGATYRSMVFQAALGIEYVVKCSDNLREWSNLPDRHYGLNHDVVIPMVERPSPGAPPPEPPPGPPPAPLKTATLLLYRVEGGGVILSFQSLDNGHPLRYHLEELTMSSEWSSLPLYVNRFDSHMFCILHPGASTEPEEENPPLGPEDQAMVEAFGEHFADMDAEVVANVVRTRTMPDPPAQAPGQAAFLKVVAREVDSDHDGTPNWMEHALAGNENPGEPPADPFNGDADGNGILDGQERDSDGDGHPDAFDAAPNDKLIDWEKSDHLVFAWFPVENGISGPVAPLQVNDRGEVLFSNSIWRNGGDLPLHAGPGGAGNVWGATPLGLGDNGAILGRGMVGDNHRLVTWPANGGQPIALQTGGGYLEPTRLPVGDPPTGIDAVPPSDMVVNKDGVFIGMKPDDDKFYKWTLEAGVAAVTGEGQVPAGTAWVADDGILCGRNVAGDFTVGAEAFGKFLNHVAVMPGGNLGVFASYASPAAALTNVGHVPRFPRLYADNTWTGCRPLEDLVGFSALGRFGMRKSGMRKNEIWMDGRHWKVRELSPGLPADWDNADKSRLVDTTRSGWTLAVRRDGEAKRTMLGAPLRLSTDVPARGLDNQSAAAEDDTKHSPEHRAGNKDEFWIMVPAGGSTTVRVKSGANAVTPIHIDQTGGITTDPVSLTGPDQTLTLSAPASATDGEFDLPLKIGAVPSSTVPIRVKVMKPRVVNVSVWPLKRPNFIDSTTQPMNLPPLPSKQDMEDYLNELYQPQLNVTFNITIKEESVMPVDPGFKFQVAYPVPTETQQALAAGKADGHIQVFVTGAYGTLWHSNPDRNLAGFANPDEKWTWMGVWPLIMVDAVKKEYWLNTLAHEIGHVFFGPNHPEHKHYPGPAALPGTDLLIRLMFGSEHPGPQGIKRLIVKAEWDRAENWLKINVDNE